MCCLKPGHRSEGPRLFLVCHCCQPATQTHQNNFMSTKSPIQAQMLKLGQIIKRSLLLRKCPEAQASQPARERKTRTTCTTKPSNNHYKSQGVRRKTLILELNNGKAPLKLLGNHGRSCKQIESSNKFIRKNIELSCKNNNKKV